jgi:hypothetical protein
MSSVLEFLWFAVQVAAFASTVALLLLGAYLALACLVGRWVGRSSRAAFGEDGCWCGDPDCEANDDEEVGS